MNSLQDQYNLLSVEILAVDSKLDEIKNQFVADIDEHKKAIESAHEKYDPRFKELNQAKIEAKEKLRLLYDYSKEKQDELYKATVQASLDGDMDEVQRLTLLLENFMLRTNGNVFYRTYDSWVVEDANLVPDEFLVKSVNWDLITEEIPGIRKVKNTSIVVKK